MCVDREPMRRYLIVVIVWAAGLATARAQAPTTVLDGVYTPAQAARGEAAYSASCSGCHEGQDADGPELTGKAFLDRWREDTLEPLFTFIKTRMPGNLPGSLDDRVYADILAYMLQANSLPAGTKELSPDMVGRIQLVGPDGPQPLSNLTIVRAVGCLSRAANNAWALANAGSPRPVRARIVDGTTPEELSVSAAQPLGTQTFPLLSVTQQGAAYAGRKVQVKGVLTRQNTIERINVMSLEPVARWERRAEGERMRAFVLALCIGRRHQRHRARSSRQVKSRRTIDSPESGNWSARTPAMRTARPLRGAPTPAMPPTGAVSGTSCTTRPAT